MGLAPLSVLLAAAFAVLAAGAIIAGLGRWARPRPAPSAESRAVFLFDGDALLDATPAARRLLRGADGRGAEARGGSDLAAVLAVLGRRFGQDLAARLADLPPQGHLRLAAQWGDGLLDAACEDGRLRLTLDLLDGDDAVDRLRLEAMADELSTLRAVAEDAPQLIWALDATGALVWANRAYLAMTDLAHPPGSGPAALPAGAWPTTPLFEPPADLPRGQNDVRRMPLTLPDRPEPQWWEVTSVRRAGGSVHFAADAGSLVHAEAARAVFVQTLTKTFATLSTGLAIFDKGRRLALFNPAFVDLTGLPISFLSGRPLVHSVLDRLRDARVLPEPRNYSTWRDQVAALEAAATNGRYCEIWTLPGGQTFRVTGRPHPDGALAFLFEDISDEVMLTRRFRAELETAQAVLDSLDDAVAVFSATGQLQLANAAYGSLWGPPAPGLTDRALSHEAARWREAALPSPFWDDLDAHLAGTAARPAHGVLRLSDGRALAARAVPLAGGATLVGFRPADIPRAHLALAAEEAEPLGFASRRAREEDGRPARPRAAHT